jgi:hypothetical protein
VTVSCFARDGFSQGGLALPQLSRKWVKLQSEVTLDVDSVALVRHHPRVAPLHVLMQQCPELSPLPANSSSVLFPLRPCAFEVDDVLRDVMHVHADLLLPSLSAGQDMAVGTMFGWDATGDVPT